MYPIRYQYQCCGKDIPVDASPWTNVLLCSDCNQRLKQREQLRQLARYYAHTNGLGHFILCRFFGCGWDEPRL